jgi:deoxyribonuclease-4
MATAKLLVGAHMSTSGGVFNAIEHGINTGSTSIQIFTRQNTRWQTKPLSDEDAEKFLVAQKESGIAPVVSHSSYLINLAGPKPDFHKKSIEAMIDEVERAEKLKLPDVVLHPGSPLDETPEYGMNKIVNSLNTVIDKTPNAKARIALELTAGQGAHLGFRFEQIAEMIDRVENKKRVSCCLDTCHIFAAGYDIRTRVTYDATMREFGKVIGFKYLKVVHLNDCKGELGSRKDRHTHIGDGNIGTDAFKFIMQDTRLDKIPKLLETPKGDDDYTMDKRNLAILKKFWKERAE